MRLSEIINMNNKSASSSDGGYWYRPDYITEDDRK